MRALVLPKLSDHGSEIGLLGALGLGVIALLWKAIDKGIAGTGFDAAAFLLVLQQIVTAVKERWAQRTVDRMGQQLGNSQPFASEDDLPASQTAAEGARKAAGAAQEVAEDLGQRTGPSPDGEDL